MVERCRVLTQKVFRFRMHDERPFSECCAELGGAKVFIRSEIFCSSAGIVRLIVVLLVHEDIECAVENITLVAGAKLPPAHAIECKVPVARHAALACAATRHGTVATGNTARRG